MENEEHRLRSLQLYDILDTATEQAFDNLTQLASMICETPISLVSIVDSERQWFKSRHGLEATETPREQAFCAHAILSDEVMIVPDAKKDHRFVDNPLVAGGPKIRFYAGAPLQLANGAVLGTLCVIDHKPRTLSVNQMQSLMIIRDAVVAQLELRRAVRDLQSLRLLVPMCAWCRSVRVDGVDAENASWQPLHEYVANAGSITHGICPQCKTEVLRDGGSDNP